MAGPYYVDPAGDNSDGLSWATAWTTLQTAADAIRAGEICYCRGHQDLGAAIDFDTAAATGTNAAGFVKFIGCNAGGTVDGTRFVLHCNGQSIHGINANGSMDEVWLENIEIYGSAAGNYDGINFNTANSVGWVFINCSFHNMGRDGIYGTNQESSSTYWRCTFYSNGDIGYYSVSSSIRLLFCSAHLNTGLGINSYGQVIGCITYDNGNDGSNLFVNNILFNCIIDSNSDDGIVAQASTSNQTALVAGCRITNHSTTSQIGLNANGEPLIYGYNVMDNNGDNYYGGALDLGQKIPIENSSNDSNEYYSENVQEAEGVLQGYTSADDYNLTGSDDTAAYLRRDPITIPTS